MNISTILNNAGVPKEHHANIKAQFVEADGKAKGMFWHKLKVRYWHVHKIVKLFRLDVERLVDIDPKYLHWDIAPVDSVTCNGDNNLWAYQYWKGSDMVWLNHDLPENFLQRDWLLSQGYTTDSISRSVPVGLPDPNRNPDYEAEKARSYWTKGKWHQRTKQSWKKWFTRNGGEGYAWDLGLPVELSESKDMWVGDTYTVRRIGNVYQISGSRKVFWKLALNYSMGYELANVYDFKTGAQKHKPIKGYELKAALTWSVLPGKIKVQGE